MIRKQPEVLRRQGQGSSRTAAGDGGGALDCLRNFRDDAGGGAVESTAAAVTFAAAGENAGRQTAAAGSTSSCEAAHWVRE